MNKEFIIIGILIVHFVVGFGWLFYKLEIEKSKPDSTEEIPK